jgi:hypothetical protein
MPEEHQGKRLTIRYCHGAAESLVEVLESLPAKKHPACLAQLVARRNQLAEVGQLRSPDHWNTEGNLPQGSKFYAIKAGKIRAYGWFSDKHKGVFYISHFIYKDTQKLDKSDLNRVCNNWRKVEK